MLFDAYSPTVGTIVDEALIAASLIVAPEVEIPDLVLAGITLACDFAAMGNYTYTIQEPCCSTTCTSDFCQNYFSVCLQSTYTGSC